MWLLWELGVLVIGEMSITIIRCIDLNIHKHDGPKSSWGAAF